MKFRGNMRKINFSYYFNWLKIFFSRVVKLFNHWEKITILVLFLICIVFGGILIYKNWLVNTKQVADFGGTYREGIIVHDKDDLTDTINRLTQIGLTKFDNNGNVIPEVAEGWEISNEVRNYTFTIKDEFSRDKVLEELKKQKDIWAGIEISAKDEDKIEFKFSEPFSPFLASTTAPVLPYGPYKLVSKDSREVQLAVNPDFYLGKPYLEKIILKIYPDKENLVKAYREKQIDGVYYVRDKSNFPNANFYTFKLPRYNMMFFNTDREIFRPKAVRKKIVNGEKLTNEISAIVVVLDSQENRKKVEELTKKWKEQNLKTEVFYKNADELLGSIIPNRDYDILIYGLDYGQDPDPYPFWHSTQGGEAGFNLSNFSNIDADVLLEEARKTADQAQRDEKYQRFWEIFKDEAPALILSQDEWIFGVSQKFRGVKKGYAVTLEDRFLYIYKWYTKTKRVPK